VNVEVTETGLLVDGVHVPVYSGAVHYWRLERERWSAILNRVKSLGFGMVETYIPWSVHETSPGVFDWGECDPRKDVDAFMRACEERGLWLLVRPGPLINAELTDFGFPEWVLLDPDVQSRTALDTVHLDAAWGLHPPRPFPVPSYASERFFELTGGWFDAVCPIIARHLAPSGCVVAVQSDNETCYDFFDQPYATDYSAGSLRLYRDFLRQLHGDVAALNSVYGTQCDSFDDVQPPRDGPITARSEAPHHLDWVSYKEHQIRWSVARLARMLRERGIDQVPIFHDVAYQYRTPLDISRMEAHPDIDWVGMNLYRAPWDHAAIGDRARFLAGSTRLPFVPEWGAGIWSHHVATPTPAEQQFVDLCALMYGVKAFSFYMLVERERWQGSPITRHAELRPEYASFYTDLLAFLGRVEFWNFKREPRALVLLSYDLGRYEAANSTLNLAHMDLLGLPPELLDDTRDLGLRWDRAAVPWLAALKSQLHTASVDYDLSDTHLDLDRLQRYAVVFVQSADFLDADDQQRLLEYVRGGGRLVLGPGAPYLDAYLRPCSALADAATTGAARVVSEADLRAAISELRLPTEFRIDDSRLDLVPHYHADRVLLFVSNPTPEWVSTRVCFAGSRRITSAWDASCPATDVEGQLQVSLDGHTIQIWQVEHVGR
jgi:beta-galactosidase